MMHKRWSYYLKYHLLTLVSLFIFAAPIFSQVVNTPADIRNTLLTAFTQIENHLPAIDPADCYVNESWTIEESLNQANQYDLEGSWKCCESILNAITKRSAGFTSIEQLHLLLAKAAYLNNRQLYDSAKAVATIANEQSNKKEWLPEKIKALLILSYGALRTRNIAAAYAWADSALQFSRKTNNKLLEGKALLQMALCARRNFTSSTRRAFPYYLQAIEAAATSADSATVFSSNMYFATDNFEVNNWQDGLPAFTNAIAIAVASKHIDFAYTACISGGYTLLQQGLSGQAMALYKKALAIAIQQQLPYYTEHAYNEISGTFQELKQYDSALLYANLAAAVPGVDSFYTNISELKAGIYSDMGNYKAAVAMYAKALHWNNEDFLYRNQDQLSSYEAKLNTKEKELQVEQEKKRSLQLEWLIGGAIILLLVAAWAYLMQRRGRQKLVVQNIIIEKQRADLEKSLGEKDMLLKEIHHRVKNNLTVISSLLELQSSSIEDEKAKAAITEGQNRVRSIALIHQRLYQRENLAAIEFGGFAEDMISQVSGIFKIPGQKIVTDIVVPETLLDIDTAVPLGLIMNELVTNSFKYAFTLNKEGLIRIRLSSPKQGNYTLVYFDNGPGLPIHFDLKKSKSLGLRLIQRLSTQIGGSAQYSSPEGGMFVITFKNAFTRNQEA